MEELEYKSTYKAINERRCVFEKAINSRLCNCSQSERFNLADREGVACKTAAGNALCTELLHSIRQNARFSLHLTDISGPLPHAREIKVQVGGVRGLQKLLGVAAADTSTVEDIYGVANAVLNRYGSISELPFDEIVQSIVGFKGRKKRSRPVK